MNSGRLIGALVLSMALVACGSAPAGSVAPSAVASSAPLPSAEASQPGGAGEPAGQRVSGIVDYYADGSAGVITAPATVTAGQPFDITITTFGGGCESAGGGDVVVAGDVATIDVFDWSVAGPTVSCVAMLKRLPRTVSVTFATPGPATIKVNGQRVGQETPGQPTTLEHQLTVQ